MKRILIAASFSALLAWPANAATTYVVLPSPGSMTPATIYVDRARSADRTFVCVSIEQIAAGKCRPHVSRVSAKDCSPSLFARLKSVAFG